MPERERIIVTGLVVLMLTLWLGFLLHSSPRFAGSLVGGLLGVAGAVLMLLPLVYLIVKRIRPLKKVVNAHVSMRTLLTWHIYAGIVGPILALLHTGHKFESALGIALTAMLLAVVVSGFVGRYLMGQFSREIKTKKAMLGTLEARYEQVATTLRADPARAALLRPFSGMFSRVAAGPFLRAPSPPDGRDDFATVVRLGESIADVEFAIKTHARFKKWFSTWLKFHIVISAVLYALLVLHIWAGVHFGLRWFEG